MDPDQEWETWRSWIGDDPNGRTIWAQVLEMLLFRQVWDGFAYVYDNAPEPAHEEGTFVFWVRFSYSRSQGLAVRRMTDKRSDVVSLARLIDRVWRYPTILSRERYVAMQSEDFREEADRLYDSMAGPGEWIDPRIPAQDFENLQARTKTVRDWVNTSVAHLTAKDRDADVVTLQEVHDAIDAVVDVFKKYQRLIRGVTMPSGIIMDYWPTIFRVPWIPDDDRYEEVLTKLDEAERRRLERPQG
jgi:AbiU2